MAPQPRINLTTLARHPFHRFQQPILYGIWLLFGVMVGGLFASFRFRDLITQSIAAPQNEQHWGALYNLYDHLIPYYLWYGGSAIVLLLLGIALWSISKTDKTN